MKEHQYFKISTSLFAVPFLFVLAIWVVYWVEITFNVNFNVFGVYPRSFSGLRGILFSPFIHGSTEHLYHNTFPLFILLSALFYFYRTVSWKVVLLGVLFSGGLTWLIARNSYHIGASGLIYVLVSFIFFKGILTKHFRLVALSLVVVFLYGGLLWYVFPVKDGVSWEGHLSGFISGLVLAYLLKIKAPVIKKYDWEKENYNEDNDPFLKHFDENGNFVELKEEEEAPEGFTVNYIFKSNEEHKK